MAIGIELKDSVIKKLKTDFIDENNKTRNQVKYYFTDCKGRGCQGLGMYHKRKTDRKVMILDYWVNDGKERILSNGKKIYGEAKRYVLGDYHKDNFNVKAIEKKITDIRAEYGSKNDLTWSVDIVTGEKLKKREQYDTQLSEIQRATFNDAIKDFFQCNCPQIDKPSETLHKTTIRENARYLMGYNDRLKALKFVTNKNNQGEIEFQESYKVDGEVYEGVKSWDEFWKKFPPKEYADIGPGKAVFDTPFGQKVLADITEHDVRHYLNSLTASPGTKKQIKESFSYVWNHAKEKTMLGKNSPNNPVRNIKIEKPTASAASKYNTKEFTDEELAKILEACDLFKDKYPFQVFVIKLMIFTGRRRETLLLLQWTYVKWNTQVTIEIPAHVNKTKVEDKFWITSNIRDALVELHKQREFHSWSMFIPWCFPSPRVKDKRFLRKGNENSTDAARLKDVRELWEEIKKHCGLTDVAMRMFRNTHENKVNEQKKAASTWDVITVTGRSDTRSSESSYLNKKLTPKTADIMDDMDSEWNRIKKIRLIK
jgi:integrase